MKTTISDLASGKCKPCEGGVRQGAAVLRQDAAQDLRFTLGTIGHALLQPADALCEPRAAREQPHQPLVERIDLLADLIELVAHLPVTKKWSQKYPLAPCQRGEGWGEG